MDIKEHPIIFSGAMVRAILAGKKTQTRRIKYNQYKDWRSGHRLWVKETFSIETNQHLAAPSYAPPFKDRPVNWIDDEVWEQCYYRATDLTPQLGYGDSVELECKWRHSIHMPRWASRINLEITKIKVQQLLDISEEDAIKEGIEAEYLSPINQFRALWESRHGQGSWSDNPLVWVTEFKQV